MPKIFDPFKLSSAVRPLYWARRQRRASTELSVSTVCTMTSSGQAAHSISQTLTKTLAFHSSRFSFHRPPVFVFARRVERACSTWRFNARMTPIRANIVGGPPARRRLGGFQSGGLSKFMRDAITRRSALRMIFWSVRL
jgi:hypothetical protein